MKNFRYVFLILAIIYLAEVIYAFIQPRESYKILTFEVPLWGFVFFRVLIGAVFIMSYKRAEKQ